MSRRAGPRAAVLLATLLAVAWASGEGRADGQRAERAVRLVDRPLVDTDGRRHRFVSDLVGRGVVVVSFTFTACSTLCPPSDLVMDALAARVRAVDGGVRLVTLTLDPVTDTPEVLARERARHSDAGRLFLTGDPRDVWAVLDGLGVAPTRDQDHDVEFLVFSAGGSRVHPLPGLVSPQDLDAAVRQAAGRGAAR